MEDTSGRISGCLETQINQWITGRNTTAKAQHMKNTERGEEEKDLLLFTFLLLFLNRFINLSLGFVHDIVTVCTTHHAFGASRMVFLGKRGQEEQLEELKKVNEKLKKKKPHHLPLLQEDWPAACLSLASPVAWLWPGWWRQAGVDTKKEKRKAI